VATLAGAKGTGYIDGTGTVARFTSIQGLTFQPDGTLVVADGHCLRRVSPAGVVTTWVGNCNSQGNADGQGTSAQFNTIGGITIDSSSNVYVTDTGNTAYFGGSGVGMRRVTPVGVVSTVQAFVAWPNAWNVDVTYDSTHNVLYALDNAHGGIYRMSLDTPASANVTLFVGRSSGSGSYKDGAGTNARFKFPYGLAIDTSGFVYVLDNDNGKVRKVSPLGNVTTLADNFDGPSLSGFITVDNNGVVFLGEGQYVRIVTPTGRVMTLTGSPSTTYPDGMGSAASFASTTGLIMQGGDIVIGSFNSDNRLRLIRDASRMGLLANESLCAAGFVPLNGAAACIPTSPGFFAGPGTLAMCVM
jgi:hypothetical protein